MNIHLKRPNSRLFRLILTSGLIATGMVNSDYVSAESFCYQRFTQGTWSKDIHNAVVNYYLIVATENQAKPGSVFVMFRTRNNPEQLWLYGREANDPSALPQWRLYENNPSRYAPKINAIIPITTGKPIDLSGLPDVGELLVGYGLETPAGTDDKALYQEMWRNNRVRVIWTTEEERNFPNIGRKDRDGILSLCSNTNQGHSVERSEPNATYPFIL